MIREKCLTASLSTLLLTLLWAGGAHAQEQFSYFGLTAGTGTMDLGSKGSFDATATARFGAPNNSSLDDEVDVWGVHVGYRFNRYVAGEIGYVNLGRGQYEANYAPSLRYSVRYLSSGPTLSVLGLYPLTDRFEIHGRAGLFLSDTRVRDRFEDRSTGAFQSTEPKSSANDLSLGIGAAWMINPSYAVRFEFTRFMDVGKQRQIPQEFDVDTLQFSLLFR
jgi:OOP family OmpA-OmpF porin